MILKGVDMPVTIGGEPLSPELQQRGWFVSDEDMKKIISALRFGVSTLDEDLIEDEFLGEYQFACEFVKKYGKEMGVIS